ncbi:MAG: hypothetical protein COA79_18280 [Planctomycetota bacterium]|nr:MAG: hypothetical protein COA79_18280 [Planctomycetota bacterium]
MPQIVENIDLEEAKANFLELKQHYASHLTFINQNIQSCLNSENKQLKEISLQIKNSPGKQFRPLLSLIVADAFGEINEHVHHYATAVELIHNASLIHDDILDDSPLRRGLETPHKKWGTKNAVLLGDYLFSVGYRQVLKTPDDTCRDDLPRVASLMCESELLQSDSKFSHYPNEENYLKIIDGKTASLFGISAGAGCLLSGGTQEQKKLMEQCGLLLGRAFQIMDDWLDYYQAGKKDGKPRGSDISAGIFTLPIIKMIAQASKEEKESLDNIIFNGDFIGFNSPVIKSIDEKYGITQDVLSNAQKYIKDSYELFEKATPINSKHHFEQFSQSIVISDPQ